MFSIVAYILHEVDIKVTCKAKWEKVCVSVISHLSLIFTIQPKSFWSNKIEPPRDKTSNVAVRPAKTQISLGIHPVWSECLLCTQWVAKDPSFLYADSEDSDQTGRMPKLIWVFAGRTYHFVGFVMRRLNSNFHDFLETPFLLTFSTC